MKKFITFILMVLSLSCAIFAVGCFEKTYTVTLDACGGTIEQSVYSFKMDERYELPTPVKEGYTFKSWMISSSKMPIRGNWSLETDVTLTAAYEANKYTVTIIDVLENEIGSYTVKYNSSYEFELPESVKPLYKGLVDVDTGNQVELSGDSWNISKNVVYMVEYKPINVTLNLNGAYGDFETEIQVEYGSMFDDTLYTPYRAGKAFYGWKYGNINCSNKVWTILKESVELIADMREYTNNH